MLELIDMIIELYRDDCQFWSRFSVGEIIDIIEFITDEE